MNETNFIKCSGLRPSVWIVSLIAFLWADLAMARKTLSPIIDMHLHSYSEDRYFVAPDDYGNVAPADHEIHFQTTYSQMRKHNIVLGVISGSKTDEEDWMAKDVDGRLVRGLYFRPSRNEWTPQLFETLVKAGKIKVFGEIGSYYLGKTIDDPIYAPYLKICEKYGVPLALHTGGGPPRIVYNGNPDARLFFGNPFLLENVLVKYPKLKVYLMHSGEFYYKEAIRLMLMYPRVYSDLGVVLWVHELPKHYGEGFLRLAKKSGLLKRVMFGSDQMVWPKAIEMSIDQLNNFDFLSPEEKRDIFYNNAARFLGLTEDEIAAHHK